MYRFIQTQEQFEEILPVLEHYASIPELKLGLDVETFCPVQNGEIPRPILLKDGTYHGYLRTIQIGLDPNNLDNPYGDQQFVIDAWKIGYDVVGLALKPILEDTLVLGQNLKYEYQFLRVHLGICLRRMIDTMLISQVLFAGFKLHHGLGDHYNRFLDYGWFQSQTGMTFKEYKEFKKTLQKSQWHPDFELTEEQLRYAADDVKYIFPVFDAQYEKLTEWKQVNERDLGKGKGVFIVSRLENELIPAYAMMELRGVKLDKNYHKTVVMTYLEEKLKEAEIKLGFTRIVRKKKTNGRRNLNKVEWYEETEEPLNLRSVVQLKKKLNELLAEIDPDLRLDSTKEDDLKDLVNTYSLPPEDGEERTVLSPEMLEKLQWVLQFKKASGLLSKYGQKMLDLCTDLDYIHPSWFQVGTDSNGIASGRSSCKNPNFQQQASRGTLFVTKRDESGKPLDGKEALKFFRTAVIADDGYILIDADYRQEEPRIASEYCAETLLIAEFAKGDIDIHGLIGKSLCGLDYQPKPGEFERDYIGKTAGLSLLYGVSWKSLKDFMWIKTDGKVKWTEDQAKEAYERFFNDYPAFREKMDEVKSNIYERAEKAGKTLVPFKKLTRPFAIAYTFLGRPRRFCLTETEIKLPDNELVKNFMRPKAFKKYCPLDEECRPIRTNWNLYNEKLSQASREGFNHAIQGTAADVLKIAALNIHKRFEQEGFHWTEGIWMLIHDEVLVHVKEEHEQLAKDIIRECMIDAGKKFLKQVPVEIDMASAKNWADAKKPPKIKVG